MAWRPFLRQALAEKHRYSAYLCFRILVCRDPHDALPQESSSEAARRNPERLEAAVVLRVGLYLTQIFCAMGLRPKIAELEDLGNEYRECES